MAQTILVVIEKLWKDLEEGIIREGARENVTNDKYRKNNPIEE